MCEKAKKSVNVWGENHIACMCFVNIMFHTFLQVPTVLGKSNEKGRTEEFVELFCALISFRFLDCIHKFLAADIGGSSMFYGEGCDDRRGEKFEGFQVSSLHVCFFFFLHCDAYHIADTRVPLHVYLHVGARPVSSGY